MHECQNCGALYAHASETDAIDDIFQRVEPGEPMPSGQCLHCGALVHEIKEDDTDGT